MQRVYNNQISSFIPLAPGVLNSPPFSLSLSTFSYLKFWLKKSYATAIFLKARSHQVYFLFFYKLVCLEYKTARNQKDVTILFFFKFKWFS